MDGSDFEKIKPQRCKIGIKNEAKTSYFGDHIRTWTVISKKKRSLPCFPISVRPAASTVFPNLALRVKGLPTRGLDCKNALLSSCNGLLLHSIPHTGKLRTVTYNYVILLQVNLPGTIFP